MTLFPLSRYMGEWVVLVMSQRGTRSQNRVTLLLSLIIQNQHPTRISDTITGTTSGPSIAGTQQTKVTVHKWVPFLAEPANSVPTPARTETNNIVLCAQSTQGMKEDKLYSLGSLCVLESSQQWIVNCCMRESLRRTQVRLLSLIIDCLDMDNSVGRS